MTTVLSYFPGQKCTIVLEVLDANGLRVNSATTPYIAEIIDPTFTAIDGYHTDMTWINTGLYYAQITLPKGAAAVGSYLVDVKYTSPITGFVTVKFYQILVNAPFANFGTLG